MPDGSFSPYGLIPGEGRTRSPEGKVNLSVATVRVLCGIGAAVGCVPAGMCFYFLVSPFGANPPPKEVALIAGIVFSAMALFLAGVALFYRGSSLATDATAESRLDPRASLNPSPRVSPSPSVVGPSAVPPSVALRSPRIKRGSLRDYLGVAALLGILIGPVLGYIAFQRQQVLDKGHPEPRTLRVAELGANGPRDNIHVKLTDFEFGDKFAVKSKKGSWTAVCLAAFPKGKAGDVRALKVLVRSSRIHNEKELSEFLKRATIEGVVVNSIYEWESDREYMKAAYPGVDTSSIWVVQENYTFPNASEIKTMYAISSAIVGLAVFCGVGMFIAKRK